MSSLCMCTTRFCSCIHVFFCMYITKQHFLYHVAVTLLFCAVFLPSKSKGLRLGWMTVSWHVIDILLFKASTKIKSVFPKGVCNKPELCILNVATSWALNHSVCLQMKILSPASHQLENISQLTQRHQTYCHSLNVFVLIWMCSVVCSSCV